MPLLLGAWYQYIFGTALFIFSLFMILLILVQQGRGGGLTGALGGAGGQSAFGAKAGDLFTRITAVWALIWFLLCIALVLVNSRMSNLLNQGPATGGGSGMGASDLDGLGGGDDPLKSLDLGESPEEGGEDAGDSKTVEDGKSDDGTAKDGDSE